MQTYHCCYGAVVPPNTCDPSCGAQLLPRSFATSVWVVMPAASCQGTSAPVPHSRVPCRRVITLGLPPGGVRTASAPVIPFCCLVLPSLSGGRAPTRVAQDRRSVAVTYVLIYKIISRWPLYITHRNIHTWPRPDPGWGGVEPGTPEGKHHSRW